MFLEFIIFVAMKLQLARSPGPWKRERPRCLCEQNWKPCPEGDYLYATNRRNAKSVEQSRGTKTGYRQRAANFFYAFSAC
jgi:hypothetical protein